MSAKPDYYEILGASEDASPREIERLYKQQAHKCHPDRGGAEEDMKALNEAYRILHNEGARREYDSERRRPVTRSSPLNVTQAAREVGLYGQALNALLCVILGLLLLFLFRFNGLWFLWPLAILAIGVVAFGIFIAHSALSRGRESLPAAHPFRRFRLAQEIIFWMLVAGGGYAAYLVWTLNS